MYDHNNTGGPSNQAKLNKPSPDRPPQFNFKNCGYDCGLGCQKASEDEGGGGGSEQDSGGDSDDDTAVGEEDNRCSVGEWQDNHGDVEAADGPEENLSSPDTAEDEAGSQLSWAGDYDAMSESLVVEPCATSDHSPVASVGGSVRSLSPNPGILYWITNMRPASPLPAEYHFLHTPLRLSPQYEHCRGDPASHLVGPDRSTRFYLIEQV
ncbi:hypothetical protein PTMSG1_01247 [Pyrenophora teres f. maculata]|nr:hypothetical protein PTMSG1_01247 [Pyrenophora teres f. maculata]